MTIEERMKYQGFEGVAEFDTEDQMFYGKAVSIRDVIGFEGSIVEELEGSCRRAVDAYVEVCAEKGKEPEKPSEELGA